MNQLSGLLFIDSALTIDKALHYLNGFCLLLLELSTIILYLTANRKIVLSHQKVQGQPLLQGHFTKQHQVKYLRQKDIRYRYHANSFF